GKNSRRRTDKRSSRSPIHTEKGRGASMKLVIVAGPPSAGKTAVIRQIIKKFSKTDKPAYLKIDVVKAFEDEELHEEFGIHTRKVYSGDLCPDHMGIMVLRDAISWAEELK